MEALAQFLGFVPNIKRVEQSHKLWEIFCSVKRKKRKEKKRIIKLNKDLGAEKPKHFQPTANYM